MRPVRRWSAEERKKRALLERGIAVAVNIRRHGDLIAWAKQGGLFVRVDRATPLGNPFVIGRDGDRATVIARYRDYLRRSPALLARLDDLRGKALGCWCAPEACHADALIEELERRGPAAVADRRREERLDQVRDGGLSLPPPAPGGGRPAQGPRP
jgi:hypothetical protein